jgi:hypothetical protein
MKTCTKCNVEKELSEFKKNTRCDDGCSSHCKECHAKTERERYRTSKKCRDDARKNGDKSIIRNKIFVYDYYSKHPCVDCGEDDVIVLHFDHVRGEKDIEVSYMAAHGYSIDRLKAEIAKCDVVCANCHMRRTAKQFNWHHKVLLHKEFEGFV